MIEYRKATLADLENIVRLRIEFLCEIKPQTDEKIQQLRQNNMQYMQTGLIDGSFAAYLAITNGEIVATGGLSMYLLPPNASCPNGKMGYISNMYTLPSHRGHGIASKLFALLVEEAKGHGCERIMLHATDMGRPIYEKQGFTNATDTMKYDILT